MKNAISFVLEKQKARLDTYRPFAPELETILHEWLRVELTYTSNAIEGNTLSRAETALVLEQGLVVGGKTLTEHLEAVGHAAAYEWAVRERDLNAPITEHDILSIHQRILQSIDFAHAGRYRSVPVRIAGSAVIMPNPLKVATLMQEFVAWLQKPSSDPVAQAIEAHYRFVSIHPFVDGNGRTGRLLMNLLLLRAGYPPAIVRKEDRALYLNSIEKGQLGGSLAEYTRVMQGAIEQAFELYFELIAGEERSVAMGQKSLLKIGEVAQLSGETVSTIRHWLTEGLLVPVSYSQGGYQLFSPEVIEVVRSIRRLQDVDRRTLGEIKALL